MNKQTIITILLALVAVAGQGQVRCYVIGTVAEGTTPVELRIYRDGEDPKNSTLRPVLKNGRFECDVEDAQIERWHIVDLGEVMKKGMTLRSGEFFVEDGATITIRLDGSHFNDTGLAAMLDIYHRQYTTLYPDHPVHQRIAEQEAVGYLRRNKFVGNVFWKSELLRNGKHVSFDSQNNSKLNSL